VLALGPAAKRSNAKAKMSCHGHDLGNICLKSRFPFLFSVFMF
jgi:hypothetical protein